MSRINQLSTTQLDLLVRVRDEWLGHGLSTAPADRAAAEAGVRQAYSTVGLPPPRLMVWLDSPAAGCIAVALLSTDPSQVGAQVRAQVGDEVGAQVGAQVGASLWGQHDAGRLAWLDACARLGISDSASAAGLCQVGKSAGWWWAFRDLALLTERPTILARDSLGGLHCEDGPAVLYPDGWAVYAVHGVRVPQRVITMQYAAADITAEPNVEVRRIMLERYGTGRWLEEISATPVHTDHVVCEAAEGCHHGPEQHEVRLYRAPQAGDEDLCMVRLVNAHPEPDGTYRVYWERVPPSVRTAREAVAWGAGMTADEYRPLVQT